MAEDGAAIDLEYSVRLATFGRAFVAREIARVRVEQEIAQQQDPAFGSPAGPGS